MIAAVVTYLEMRHPPNPLPQPASSVFSLEAWGGRTLEHYRNLFQKIGADWLWFSRLTLDDQALQAKLDANDLYVLRHDSQDKGMLELDRNAFPDIEITFFGVAPDLVGGKGAGAYLMAQALNIAWAHNPQRLWLHTCTLDHPSAISFYQRQGFKPYKRAIEIAADPRLNGILPPTAAPRIPVI
jgi:GNAT superfamily N-acetyltransferase